MSRGYRYLTVNMFMGCLLFGGWSGSAQAISFISGDGTGCGAGPNSECVQVNPKTTIQPGHPSTAPEVTIFDGHGGPTAFTHQNVDQWYNPANPNPFDPGGASLNASTGLTGYWVSYTDSGVDADPSQTNPPNFESPYPNHNPNPPAVPNYCGTKGGGFTGVGGNVNTTGTPKCTGFDEKRMQNIPPPDPNRVKGNQ